MNNPIPATTENLNAAGVQLIPLQAPGYVQVRFNGGFLTPHTAMQLERRSPYLNGRSRPLACVARVHLTPEVRGEQTPVEFLAYDGTSLVLVRGWDEDFSEADSAVIIGWYGARPTAILPARSLP